MDGEPTLIRLRMRDDGSFTLHVSAPNFRSTWRLDRETQSHFCGNLRGFAIQRSEKRMWLVERYSDCVAVHWYGTSSTSLFLKPSDAEWLAAVLSSEVELDQRDRYGIFVEKSVESVDIEADDHWITGWHHG